MAAKSWLISVPGLLLEVSRRVLYPPVRADTLDPQASWNEDGLGNLFDCTHHTHHIALLFDEKYFLPRAVLVCEPPSAGDMGPSRSSYTGWKSRSVAGKVVLE